MSNSENQSVGSTDESNPGLSGATRPANEPIDARRRRFSSAGIAASGVLVSLACQPVLGQVTTGTATCHASAGSSGTQRTCTTSLEPQTSPVDADGTALYARGATPSYWIASAQNGKWSEAQGLACSTAFGEVFNQCSATPAQAGRTLLQALANPASGSPDGLAQLLAASYLNVVSGKTRGYLSESDLQHMAAGTFAAGSGGAAWDRAKTVAYLRLTMESLA